MSAATDLTAKFWVVVDRVTQNREGNYATRDEAQRYAYICNNWRGAYRYHVEGVAR